MLYIADWLSGVQCCRKCFAVNLQSSIGLVRYFCIAKLIAIYVYGIHCRLGILFCPLLYTINTFKYVVLFYVRLIGVILFNKPPKAMFKVLYNNYMMNMVISALIDFFNKQFLLGYVITNAVFDFLSCWLCCSWNHSIYYMWTIQVNYIFYKFT